MYPQTPTPLEAYTWAFAQAGLPRPDWFDGGDNSRDLYELQFPHESNRVAYWFAKYVVAHPDDFSAVPLDDGTVDVGGYLRRSQKVLSGSSSDYEFDMNLAIAADARTVDAQKAAQQSKDADSTWNAVVDVIKKPSLIGDGLAETLGGAPTPASTTTSAKSSSKTAIAVAGVGLGALAWYAWRWVKGGL